MAGKLIAFTGPDGTGKTTQVHAVSDGLIEAGHSVKIYKFPDFEPRSISHRKDAKLLRGYLYGNKPLPGPLALASLFARNRSTLVPAIKRDLVKCDYVLADRYSMCNAIYYAAAMKLPDTLSIIRSVLDMERSIYDIPSPDETFFVDTPKALRDERLSLKNKDNIEKDVIWRKNVDRCFEIASQSDIGLRRVLTVKEDNTTLLLPHIIAAGIVKHILNL